MFGLHLKCNDLASLFQAVCTSCTIYMVFCVNQIEHANVFIHIMTITFILYETFVKLLNLLNSSGLLFYLNYGESSQEERHCRVWENPLDGRNFLSFRVLFEKNNYFSKTYSYRNRHDVIENYILKAMLKYTMVIIYMFNSR